MWESEEADFVVDKAVLTPLDLLWHVYRQGEAIVHPKDDELAVE
jgi:hypothetical protein